MAGEENEKHTDDLRSQFREALERKRGQRQDGAAGPAGGDSKVHERHGKAAAKRQFRRKSG